MEKLRHLQGTRDLSQKSWASLKTAQDRLRSLFASYGYRVLETPVLEPTELFLRKSGGELAARMYAFTDPGGDQVSLRPEYTASIVRHYLEDDASPIPARVQYAGPVFRYEGDSKGYRQFTQVGAELLGSSDLRADAEILSLSCAGLSSLGLTDLSLELGNLGVPYQLLGSLGLSDRAMMFILGSLKELKGGQEGLDRVRKKAKQLRILAPEFRHSHLSAAIQDMEEDDAAELLHGLLEWAEAGSMGQREPSEVVERLLRKFRGTDDPSQLQQGLEIAYGLATIQGEPERCLKDAENLIKSQKLDPSALDGLRRLTDLLEMDQLDGTTLVLDFGLAGGLAYYGGIVFQIRHPSAAAPLAGGGRYDGLARALGSRSDIPALGFACTLELLLDVLEQAGRSPERCEAGPRTVLVLASSGEAYRKALRLAREMRDSGATAEMDLYGRTVEDARSYARANGIVEIISVDGNGKSTEYRVQEG